MAKRGQIRAICAASCRRCRELVEISETGAIVDPKYARRAVYRSALYKGHGDGPPRQSFSTQKADAAPHLCDFADYVVARQRWERLNPTWPWVAPPIGDLAIRKGGGA